MGAADSALEKAIAELQARSTGEERIAEAVRLMVEQRKNAEVERATQELFSADLETYKGTKHEAVVRRTLESAVRAGVSNTGTSRAFVRFVAKVSAEVGIPFAFKSGEQIKADFIRRQTEAIANLDSIVDPTMEQADKLASLKDTLAKVQSGEIVVNGDVTSDGIVLNVDSAKPLNRVVGHEVTHSLENAKYYKELRNALFAYARTKGVDIDSRLADLEKMYEGIADANPEAELIADLVGDYLFTDYDFIQNLSVNHRNVFQKIYDEIKYLCRLVTAGSKEARELEQVKRAFEQAYRAEKNTANNSSAKYHASPSLKNPKYLDPKTVTKEDVANALNDIAAGEYNDNSYVPIRISTPGIIQEKLFARDLPMAAPVHKIAQAMREDFGVVEGKNIRGHGFSPNDIIAIIEKMDSPEYLFFQPANNRGVAVVRHETRLGETTVFMEFDCNINPAYLNGYEGGTYNLAISPFNVDGGMVGLFEYAQKNHWIEVFNKAKEGDPAKKFPATRPFAVEQDSLAKIIPTGATSVKQRLSLSESNPKQVATTGNYDVYGRDLKPGSASETVAESATVDGAERAPAMSADVGDMGANPAMGAADSALEKAIAELQARSTGEERIAEAVRLMVEQRKNAEVERATQELFSADLETYKGTKHEAVVRRTLESAVRAGVSNTGTSRAFVRFVAKVSAEVGIPFAFKSGEQIKADFIRRQTEAIANLESIVDPTMEQADKLASLKDTLAKVQSGEIVVNGDFTSDGIVLNVDSAKPLNRVVGHEVTHSLENAKYYKELRNALFAYARTKGVDIDSRLADLGKMYEGIANANPEAELIADLVGDYLFTDYDFIQNLSVNHRNVFQKIYDEIKYLCRLVTAGSQEARELEQVKRAFEKAYRAEVTLPNEIKYSVTAGMTDSERYNELKNKNLAVITETKTGEYADEVLSLEELKKKAKSKAEDVIYPLASEIGITTKQLSHEEIDIDFIFSKNGGLKESLSKQLRYGGNYADFAKAMINLDRVLESAILIEVHGDKYAGTSRADENLEAVYVLLGAFQDETNIIPVQMEIKKSSDVGGRLYMTVALTKIEADVLGSAPEKVQTRSLISASNYSLADIVREINPEDAHFLKYLPDDMLSQAQIAAKNWALSEDFERIERYRKKKIDNDYMVAVNRDDTETVQKIADVRHSLSGKAEDTAYIGNYDVYSKDLKPGTATEIVAESATVDGAERAPAMGAADSVLAKAIAELRARPTGEERIAEAVRLMVEQRENSKKESVPLSVKIIATVGSKPLGERLAGDVDLAYSKTKDTQEGVVNTYGEEGIHLRDGSQWTGSTYPGRTVSRVEEGAGRNQSWQAETVAADTETARLSYGEKVSTASLGIVGGSAAANIRIVTGGDTVSTAKARALAARRGLQLVLFAGDNLNIREEDRTMARARGYIIGDRVFVRVDDPLYTADQLMRHEAGHDMITKGEIDPDDVREHIDGIYGWEHMEYLSGLYNAAYEGSGLTADEIWEEVICDSLGDMNIFAETIVGNTADVLLQEVKAKNSGRCRVQQRQGTAYRGCRCSWQDEPGQWLQEG